MDAATAEQLQALPTDTPDKQLQALSHAIDRDWTPDAHPGQRELYDRMMWEHEHQCAYIDPTDQASQPSASEALEAASVAPPQEWAALAPTPPPLAEPLPNDESVPESILDPLAEPPLEPLIVWVTPKKTLTELYNDAEAEDSPPAEPQAQESSPVKFYQPKPAPQAENRPAVNTEVPQAQPKAERKKRAKPRTKAFGLDDFE